MTCKLVECCQFFNNTMKDMPKAADYIKSKLCLGDYQACIRYQIYTKFGGENVPSDIYPDDVADVKKAIDCLRKGKKP